MVTKHPKPGNALATSGSLSKPKSGPVRLARLSAPALLEELKTVYNGRSDATIVNSINTNSSSSDIAPDATLVHIEKLAAREPVFQTLTDPLPDPLQAALTRRGINQLYSHQTQTIEALRAGHNVALITATASGKTLSFNVPVLETILAEPNATALYIFPTNALMNDQLATLNQLIDDLGEAGSNIQAFKYNGSMSEDEKKSVRRSRPNILLTNPELIHLSLTAWHRTWAQFLRNLRYIVIDEVHTYRGVFGSHIAHLLRRLRRVCAFYGANPQIICCSATIGNPTELVEKLTGLNDFVTVDNDGSRKNERYFVVWKPPTFKVACKVTTLLPALIWKKPSIYSSIWSLSSTVRFVLAGCAVMRKPCTGCAARLAPRLRCRVSRFTGQVCGQKSV